MSKNTDFKRYKPLYKDAKSEKLNIEWLLEIPDTWKVIKLKRVTYIENSGIYGLEENQLPINIPVCTTAHITSDNKFLINNMPLRSFNENDLEHYVSKVGDIFIVKSSGSNTNVISGKLGLVTKEMPPIIFSNFLMRIRCQENILTPVFLKYFLSSELVKNRVKRMVSTTTYPNIDVNEYSSQTISIPPLSEQKAIAHYLDQETAKIDELIKAKKRLLELLDEKRRALITHAVTRGLNPDVTLHKVNIPWLDLIPRHWNIERAKYLFTQSSLSVRDEDEIVTCFRDGQVTLRRNRREEGFTNAILELGYQGIRAGQLVLHSMDAFAGAIGISDSDGKCSPEYIICDPINENLVFNPYYGYLLQEMARRGFIQASCPAVRERAPRIRFSGFAEMLLPIPPLIEQKAIVNYINNKTYSIDSLIATTNKTIKLLQERRTSLITAAVTGQIKIKE